MKSANPPVDHVTPEFSEAAEQVLPQGESFSGFIERGLLSREDARHSGCYSAAEAVLGELE